MFNVFSLFANVPIREALEVITNRLHKLTVTEWSILKVEAIMELTLLFACCCVLLYCDVFAQKNNCGARETAFAR
jgi:hypothetical protein